MQEREAKETGTELKIISHFPGKQKIAGAVVTICDRVYHGLERINREALS